MNKDLRLTFRRGDLFAVALVVFIALGTVLAFLPSGTADENNSAQIYMDSALVKEVPLSADTSFSIEGNYQNTILVEGGKIRISESNCPGGDCVHSGAISSPGRSIVCLPNRLEIRVTGTSDVDFVVR